MLVLRHDLEAWPVKISGLAAILSGQRILRKKDLARVLEKPIENYRLEIAINSFMLKHKRKIAWAPCSAINTYKISKLGVWKGLESELAMFSDIFSYAGAKEIVKQAIAFAGKKIKLKRK